jgi:hypothetical protein
MLGKGFMAPEMVMGAQSKLGTYPFCLHDVSFRISLSDERTRRRKLFFFVASNFFFRLGFSLVYGVDNEIYGYPFDRLHQTIFAPSYPGLFVTVFTLIFVPLRVVRSFYHKYGWDYATVGRQPKENGILRFNRL